MAKLTDKFFNRIIEGPLELQSEDEKQVEDLALSAVESADGLKILENIEDAQGHKRFFEIPFTPSAIEGLDWGYTKASLNGKELNIVLRGSSNTAVAISSSTALCVIDIPQWLADKIFVNTAISSTYVMSSYVFIDNVGTLFFKDAYLEKHDPHFLKVSVANSISTSGDTYFNIEFHLIIE